MANPNIFMQALQPVRSVADYAADMDEADSRRQRNALQALVLDQTQLNNQYEQKQRQQQQIAQAKLAALLQASGGDDTKFVSALRSSGDPTLWAKAGDVEKGMLERRNTQSQIAEREAKTAKETSDMQAARRKDAVLRIGMAATPEHAAAIINSESDIPMQHRTQMLQTLQQHANAGKFVDWKLLVALGAMNAEQQSKALRPEYTDAGGQLVNVNPMAQGAPIQKTQTFADKTAAGNLRVAQERLQFDQQQGRRPEWDAASGSFIDRANRTVMPALGTDGKPIAGKAGTVEEKSAAGYAARMVEATKLLDKYEKDGSATYTTRAAGAVPFVGDLARTAVMEPAQQMYRQAQEDWVRAKLRKESGAVIVADEMEREIQTYFPQPGESLGVKEQKRRARAVANEAMQRAAGRASYASEVPEVRPPRLATPEDPNANVMDLLNRADAIVNGGR